MSPRRGFPLLLLTALFALPSLAGNYRWTIQGPDGGSINRLELDPVDPSIVYAGTSNGLFRSADGGEHWTAAGLLGISVFEVAVAASDPQKALASSVYGLYGSADRGVTWAGILTSTNGGASWSSPKMGAVLAVAIDPLNPGKLLASASMNLFRSTDGGATFALAGAGLTAFLHAGHRGRSAAPRTPARAGRLSATGCLGGQRPR